jgi:hypothetical protein
MNCIRYNISLIIIYTMDVVKHIKAMCGYDVESYTYLINWCAYIVQNSYKATHVAIVLYDPNYHNNKLFVRALKHIFTNDYDYLTNEEVNFGRNRMERYVHVDYRKYIDKKIIIGNDIDGKDRYDAKFLNHIITRDNYRAEFRGQMIIENNRNNFIFTSTNETPIKVLNWETIYCFIDCSHYSKATNDILDDTDEFFDYLRTRDITRFKRLDIPMNNLRKKNILHYAPLHIHMVLDDVNKFKDRKLTPNEIVTFCEKYAKDNNKINEIASNCINWFFRDVFGGYYNGDYYYFKDMTKKKLDELIETNYIYDQD